MGADTQRSNSSYILNAWGRICLVMNIVHHSVILCINHKKMPFGIFFSIPLRGPISNYLRWMLGSFWPAEIRKPKQSRRIVHHLTVRFEMDSVLEVFPLVVTNHISVKAAVEFSGYSLQYLRRLLRCGKFRWSQDWSGLVNRQISLWILSWECYASYWPAVWSPINFLSADVYKCICFAFTFVV